MVRELSRDETRKRVERSNEGFSFAVGVVVENRVFSLNLFFTSKKKKNKQDDASSSAPFPRAAAALARARASVSAIRWMAT